jgi:WD40 repeat protein/tetratricopeptide (TPR) repeat protein
MSIPSSSRDYGRFDELAEEFAERYRRGERPSLQEYIDRLPEMADEIREMFPALVEVERVEGDVRDDAIEKRPAVPRLKELGDYRIVRQVGRGGMGVVYEAEQISLGRRVALKVLPGHVVGDRKALERFRREAKAAARLHHTNIVPVFEVGQAGDVAFYAMQFIQGQALDQVIDELGRLRDRGAGPAGDAGAGSRSDAKLADGTETPMLIASGPRNRKLAHMAESLLSGRLGTEALDLTSGSPLAATDPDASKPFDPDLTAAAESRNPGEHFPEPPSGAGVATSAMLPGGTAVSSVESSHRRQPYFRGVAQIGRQAAQGLAYAHSRGIIHRDIKPSNLLLDTAGVVWITDFGLAKADEDGLTATGDILGTLRYMAPERFRGEGDARADVYALGVTLYELLTLRPAYHSSDRLKLITQVKTEEPARPRSLDSRIPRDLETIVLKAIEKEPGSRYQSADAMAEDLRRFLADEPIRARQASAAERYWRWARRNPLIATLGGALTAVLVMATVISLIFAGRMANLAEKERSAGQAERFSRLEADQARDAAKKAQNLSARQASDLLLDRGIEDAKSGEPARALHLFVRALQTLPAGDPNSVPLERVIRANLSAWAETLPPLEHIWPDGPPFTDIAVSPDGEQIAMAVGSDVIQCFRTDSGQPAGPAVKLQGAVGEAMAFAPDGQSLWVASPGKQKVVDRWSLYRLDPAAGRAIQPPIATAGPVLHLAVTPNGRFVVGTVAGLHPQDRGPADDATGDRMWRTASIMVWEAASGRIVRKVDVNAEDWASFTGLAPDGKSVTAWVLRESQCFEGMTFTVDGNEAPVSLGLHPSGPRSEFALQFQNNMRTALAIKDGRIHRWSVTKPGVLDLGVPTPFRFMLDEAAPDGRSVVSRNDYRVFDTGAWPPRASGIRFAQAAWRSERGEYNAARYSPDGRFIASWSLASKNGRRLWRIPRSSSRPPLPPAEIAHLPERSDYYYFARFDRNAMRAVLWWRSHRSFARYDTLNVRLVDTATGATRDATVRHTAGVRDVAFAPDGRYFATASDDSTARVWEAATGRPAGPSLPHTNFVATVAFSPDGNTLAAGDYGRDGLIKLWDWRAGKEVRPPFRHDDIVLNVEFSPDGRYLSSLKTEDWSKNPEFLVWEVGSGRSVIKLSYSVPTNGTARVAQFRPDGRAVAARDANGVLRLWAVPSGRLLGERPLDGDGMTRFSPDGRVIAAAANLGVRLLDGDTLAPLQAGYLPHPDPIRDVAFSPDGAFLLTAHETGSAQLWDVPTRKPIGPPAVLMGPIRAVTFSPDSKTCMCVAADGTVRRWPVHAPFPESDIYRLADRVALLTGQAMDNSQGVDLLPADEWRSLRTRLVKDGSTALVPQRPDADWHDAVAADAEQDGGIFGAEWHLDRLAALRPNDWTIPARRGRVLARAGRRDLAAAAYDKAAKLVRSPVDLADWLRAAAADDEAAKRYDQGLWNLDRAVKFDPNNWAAYAARAALADRAGQFDRGTSDIDEAIRLGADGAVLIQAAERAAGRATQTAGWARVATLLEAAAKDSNLSIELRCHLAIACCKAGDHTGYRAACAGIAGRMPPKGSPLLLSDALVALTAFAVGAGATDNWSQPLSWVDRTLRRYDEREKAEPALKEGLKIWRYRLLRFRGAILYRARRFEEVKAVLRDSMALQPQGGEFYDWLFLALAEHALGRVDEARAAAARARAAQPAATIGSAWDRAELDLLAAELDAVMPPLAK